VRWAGRSGPSCRASWPSAPQGAVRVMSLIRPAARTRVPSRPARGARTRTQRQSRRRDAPRCSCRTESVRPSKCEASAARSGAHLGVDAVEPVGRVPLDTAGKPSRIAPARREVEAIPGQSQSQSTSEEPERARERRSRRIADLVVLFHHRGSGAKHGRDAEDRPVPLRWRGMSTQFTSQGAPIARRATQGARHRLARASRRAHFSGTRGRPRAPDVEDLLRGQICWPTPAASPAPGSPCAPPAPASARTRARRLFSRSLPSRFCARAAFARAPSGSRTAARAGLGACSSAVSERRTPRARRVPPRLAICGVDGGDQLTELPAADPTGALPADDEGGDASSAPDHGCRLAEEESCTKFAP